MPIERQPKIELEQTPADRILEGVAAAGLVVLLALPAAYLSDLRETIPTHFDAAGKADGFGPKRMIWLLPLIGLGLYVMLTFINLRPHNLNYPFKITPENAERQYKTATRLVRIMKTLVMVLFAYIGYAIINGALSGHASVGAGLLWITLGSVFGTIGWYWWAAIKGR